jgi:hypothetical protein
MPLQSDGLAPYAPTATVLAVIERARSRGLPNPVTKEVLIRAGVPESLIARTLQSLQLLELINDDGTWTPNLENLRRCAETEFQPLLTEIIRSVYSDVFQYVDPAKDSTTAVRDAFRAFTPHGQQNRMVTLFLGLCQKAGIIAGDGIPKTTQREKRTIQTKRIAAHKTTSKTRPSNENENLGGVSGLPAPLAGLLATLPKSGSGWNQEDRNRFVRAFETILDYCIPIRSHEPEEFEEEPE